MRLCECESITLHSQDSVKLDHTFTIFISLLLVYNDVVHSNDVSISVNKITVTAIFIQIDVNFITFRY